MYISSVPRTLISGATYFLPSFPTPSKEPEPEGCAEYEFLLNRNWLLRGLSGKTSKAGVSFRMEIGNFASDLIKNETASFAPATRTRRRKKRLSFAADLYRRYVSQCFANRKPLLDNSQTARSERLSDLLKRDSFRISSLSASRLALCLRRIILALPMGPAVSLANATYSPPFGGAQQVYDRVQGTVRGSSSKS